MDTQADNRVAFLPLPAALIIWSAIALFFQLVSWTAGGDKFFDNNLYGTTGLTAVAVILAVGVVLHLMPSKRD
jgi:hypothetical protein